MSQAEREAVTVFVGEGIETIEDVLVAGMNVTNKDDVVDGEEGGDVVAVKWRNRRPQCSAEERDNSVTLCE